MYEVMVVHGISRLFSGLRISEYLFSIISKYLISQ